MKKTILLILLVSIQSVSAQTIKVLDDQSNKPLDMVNIGAKGAKFSAITNSQGRADISSLKKYDTLIIQLFSYDAFVVSQQDLSSSDYTVYLKSAIFNQDEFVISATRWRQSKKEVPQQITAITKKDVQLQNPQTAADLLSVSGEVFIQKSQQGGGSPMIRGFASNRLLYTVDGVRMNTAIFRGGNIQNVISLDPLAMENVEVLFGPGAVIYGSDAIGGVMGFQTLVPELSSNDDEFITGTAMIRHSSANNELSGHADISVGWKKWAILTSFSHNRFSDLRMGANGPTDYLKSFYVQRVDSVDQVVENLDPRTQVSTGYSQMNIMQKIRYKPNKKWDVEYGFHFSETSDFDRYDRLIETTPDGLPRSAVWRYGPQKWMMNTLSVTHFGENKIYDYMTIRLAQQSFEESRIDRRFNHHRERTQRERVDAYSANIDFAKKAGKHRFFYGTEVIWNDVMSIGSAINILDNSPIAVQDRYPQSTWSTLSGYFNYQFHVNEKIVAQTGVRYSHYQINSDFTRHLDFFPYDFTTIEINNGSFNGTLGITYNPTKKWSFSVNTSTGFRAPNVDDIGKIFDFSAGDIVVPNTQLEAEYAYSAEASVSKIFGTFMKVDVSGFYTFLDNAMVRREFSLNGQDSMLYDGDLSKVYAIQNAAYGTVYGFHTNIEFNLNKGFRLSTKFNYQLGVEEMEDGTVARSRHAAPWFGITKFSYSKKQLDLQLYATYSGEVSAENLNPEEQQKPFIYARDETGELYSPSWYTLNFKAMYQVTEKLSFSAGVENITDQRYRPYSSGLAAAGRNFILSFMLRF